MKTIRAQDLKTGDEILFRGKANLIKDKTVRPKVIKTESHTNPNKILVYLSLSPTRLDFNTQNFPAQWKRNEEVTIK